MTINTYASNFSLNDDLIQKLKTAETSNINKRLSNQLENLDKNKNIQSSFYSLFNNLYSLLKEEVYDYSATSTGKNISFSSDKNLKEGSYIFNVSSLYKENVFESSSFQSKYNLYGDETIKVGENSFSTNGMTVEDVINKLNELGVDATFQKINNTENKIVVKGNIESEMTQKQEASPLKVNIDGIDYEFDSNEFEFNNIKVSVNDIGSSLLNIKKDGAGTKEKLDVVINKYNELVSFTNDTIIYNPEFSDKSTIREMMSQLKNEFFKNGMFELGFSMDKEGKINTADISIEKATDFLSKLEMQMFDNKVNLDKYVENFNSNRNKLENEIKDNLEKIDKKYSDMKNQFIAYNQIISAMELNFSSLKQIMELKSNNG